MAGSERPSQPYWLAYDLFLVESSEGKDASTLPLSYLLKGSLEKEFIDLFSHLLALALLFNEGKAYRCNKRQGTPENKG